jgi:septum formation protein
MAASMQLILASTSPRRKELLGTFKVPFQVMAPDFDEESIPFRGDAAEYVREIARGKALAIARQYPGALVLAADTTVYRAGKVYGKPADAQSALAMVGELSGGWHSVWTGVTLVRGEQLEEAQEETCVEFNPVNPEQIERYHRAINYMDKCGAYTIQGPGCLLVRRIEGCTTNVLGLPIQTTRQLMARMGVDLWDFVA